LTKRMPARAPNARKSIPEEPAVEEGPMVGLSLPRSGHRNHHREKAARVKSRVNRPECNEAPDLQPDTDQQDERRRMPPEDLRDSAPERLEITATVTRYLFSPCQVTEPRRSQRPQRTALSHFEALRPRPFGAFAVFAVQSLGPG
jgi:hypothetical protein